MKYLYFILFSLLEKLKTNTAPTVNAIILLSLFELLYILAFIRIGITLLSLEDDSILIIGIIGFFILLLFNYWLFFKNIDKIKIKYEKISKLKFFAGLAILIVFFLSAMIIFYIGVTYFLG